MLPEPGPRQLRFCATRRLWLLLTVGVLHKSDATDSRLPSALADLENFTNPDRTNTWLFRLTCNAIWKRLMCLRNWTLDPEHTGREIKSKSRSLLLSAFWWCPCYLISKASKPPAEIKVNRYDDVNEAEHNPDWWWNLRGLKFVWKNFGNWLLCLWG